MDVLKRLNEIKEIVDDEVKGYIEEALRNIQRHVTRGQKDVIRFAHISDIHISERMTIAGKNVLHPLTGRNKRFEDIKRCFMFVVNECLKNDCDFVLITEPFDRYNPTPNEISLFVEGILLLSSKMPVIIEPGNHGLDRNFQNSSVFDFLARYKNVFVAMEPTTLFFDGVKISHYNKGKKGVFIHIIPYPTRYVKSTDVNEIRNEVKGFIENFRNISSGRPSVLLGHFTLQEVMPIFNIREPYFSVSELEGFSYIALGHIHKYQKVTERCFYSGSIERIDFAEQDDAKGFLICDLNILSNEIDVRFVETPATPMKSFTVDELLNFRKDEISSDVLYRVIGEIDVDMKGKLLSAINQFQEIAPISVKVRVKPKPISSDLNNKLIFQYQQKNLDIESLIKDCLINFKKTIGKEDIEEIIHKHRRIVGQ